MKSADLAWAMGDIGIGMMAWVNFIAILLLQGIAFKCLRDYEEQKHLGLDPTFDPAKLGITNAEYWTESQRETNTILEKSSGVDNRVLSTCRRSVSSKPRRRVREPASLLIMTGMTESSPVLPA